MNNWKKVTIIYLVFSYLYGLMSYLIQLDAYPFVEYSFVWITGIIFLIVFSGIGISAYSLLRTNKYKKFSIALQILQLVGFCIDGYKYEFAAGALLKWLYENDRLELVFKPITAEFTVGMNLPAQFLYVNLFPLLIIYLITKFFAPKYASDQVANSV